MLLIVHSSLTQPSDVTAPHIFALSMPLLSATSGSVIFAEKLTVSPMLTTEGSTLASEISGGRLTVYAPPAIPESPPGTNSTPVDTSDWYSSVSMGISQKLNVLL